MTPKFPHNSENLAPHTYGIQGGELQMNGCTKLLKDQPVTLMIGGEERVDKPFYSPEVVAIVIAELLTKGCPQIIVRTYPEAAHVLARAPREEYFSPEEQIERIRDCLTELDIAERENNIRFITPEGDKYAQKILTELDTEKMTDPILRELLSAFENDSNFEKAVRNAIPENQRKNPHAHKYVLFELAMILYHKPQIKAGDVREKKYDTIVDRFMLNPHGILHKISQVESLPTIYWQRDKLLRRYGEYAREKNLSLLREKEKKQSRRIRGLMYSVGVAVGVALAAPGLGYYLGKMEAQRDSTYAALDAMQGRDKELYDQFRLALDIVAPAGKHPVRPSDNPLLLEKIPDFLGTPLSDSEIRERNLRDIPMRMMINIVSKTSMLHNVDISRKHMYQKMVLEICEKYINYRIFRSWGDYEKIVLESEVLRAAQKFLMISSTNPVMVKEEKNKDSWPGYALWSELELEETLKDRERNIQYMIGSDPHIGFYFFGPDAYIPERRKTLLMICESFFPVGEIARNYTPDVVVKIQSLYRALLPVLQEKNWENFEYWGIALQKLSEDENVRSILATYGHNPDHLKTKEIREYIGRYSFWELRLGREFPDPAVIKINKNIYRNWSQHLEKNRDFMIQIGSKDLDEYIELLKNQIRKWK